LITVANIDQVGTEEVKREQVRSKLEGLAEAAIPGDSKLVNTTLSISAGVPQPNRPASAGVEESKDIMRKDV
jgi:hypothetical protein